MWAQRIGTRWYPWGIQRLVSTYSQLPLKWGMVFWKVKTQSAKICLNPQFQFSGGGGMFWKVKTQSAKICLNFNFQAGGGDVLNQISD